eukprot:2602647-Prymnesium_polylepis.1
MPTSEDDDRAALEAPTDNGLPAGVAAERREAALAYSIGHKAHLARIVRELQELPDGAMRKELLGALRRARYAGTPAGSGTAGTTDGQQRSSERSGL